MGIGRFWSQERRRAEWWLLGLVLLLGCVLRALRLRFVTLWYDEYLTLKTIGLPWQTIILGKYPKELHPPLYFLVLKGWTALLGGGETTMRLFSLLLGVASLFFVWWLARELGNWITGVGATLLIA